MWPSRLGRCNFGSPKFRQLFEIIPCHRRPELVHQRTVEVDRRFFAPPAAWTCRQSRPVGPGTCTSPRPGGRALEAFNRRPAPETRAEAGRKAHNAALDRKTALFE